MLNFARDLKEEVPRHSFGKIKNEENTKNFAFKNCEKTNNFYVRTN